jgi:RNA methyltransferase, TrmH family
MISKNKIKFIQSLANKKGREESGLFIAEGEKLLTELIKANYHIQTIISTDAKSILQYQTKCEFIFANEIEMKKMSLLKTPSCILALVKQPTLINNRTSLLTNDLILALDAIQDPGNLGTIIRLASWFGIRTIICSNNCVDCFNPKVIQSTMGAIAHVQLFYTHLPNFLSQALIENRFVYGTFLEGQNIYTSQLKENGIIVLGNEGNGISEEVKKHITHKIVIPAFTNTNENIESLNVSLAAAIVCSEFRRRIQ